MSRLARNNEIVRHNQAEPDKWCLVRVPSGIRYVLFETRSAGDAYPVDHLLPGMDAVALITLSRVERSELPAVMLTGHGDAATAVAALKAGASDMIEKPASAGDLLASVRHAMETIDDGHAPAASHKTAQSRFSNLTARERAVLERVLDGEPNKIIAADLGISQRTVEHHRATVMHKTGAASLPDLVRLALAANVLSQ